MSKLLTPVGFLLVAIFAITISISLLNHEHDEEIYNDYKHFRKMQQIQSDDIDTLYRLVEKLHQPQANIMMYEQHHDVGLEKLRRWTEYFRGTNVGLFNPHSQNRRIKATNLSL